MSEASDALDLIAQQQMAQAAWWMVWLSALTVLVSAVGTLLLFVNLVEARRITEAGIKSLEAAREANSIHRREFVFEHPPTIEVSPQALYMMADTQAKAVLRNRGTSTAFDVRYCAAIFVDLISRPGDTEDFPRDLPGAAELLSVGDMRYRQEVGILAREWYPSFDDDYVRHRVNSADHYRFVIKFYIEYKDETGRCLFCEKIFTAPYREAFSGDGFVEEPTLERFGELS